MDFSKQLANLQRSARSAAAGAASASASSSGRNDGSDERSRGGAGGGREGGGGGRKRGRDDYEHYGQSSHGRDNHRRRDGRGGNDGGWRGRSDGQGWNHHRHGWNGGGRGRRDNWRGGEQQHRSGGSGGREQALSGLVQSILANPYKGHPKTPAATPDTSKPRHLALLFLTIDDLPFEHIWRSWLGRAGCTASNAKEGMIVSVLCHAKYPDRVKSSWLKERLLIDKRSSSGDKVRYHTRRPEWGSVEITRAMIDLVEEGLTIGSSKTSEYEKETSTADDSTRRFVSNTDYEIDSERPLPPVDRFIFVSETCIPIATLDEVGCTLFGTDSRDSGKSWLKARNTPNNGYARQQQWQRMSRSIPTDNIWKADQWILLIREHAEAIARAGRSGGEEKGAELWECFRRTRASDELYFPTTLSLLGVITTTDDRKDNIGDEVACRRITYCDWSMSAKNPASFNVLLQGCQAKLLAVVRKAREEGCLFARKFVLGEIGPFRPSSSSASEKFDTEKWIGAIQKFVKKSSEESK